MKDKHQMTGAVFWMEACDEQISEEFSSNSFNNIVRVH